MFARGEIYMVDLDPTAGSEQSGRRPVLVVSPDNFNNMTNLPVILPITNGGAFAKRIAFAVELTGIQTTGIVRCDQPRVLDITARKGTYKETLPEDILDDVLARVVTLFE